MVDYKYPWLYMRKQMYSTKTDCNVKEIIQSVQSSSIKKEKLKEVILKLSASSCPLSTTEFDTIVHNCIQRQTPVLSLVLFDEYEKKHMLPALSDNTIIHLIRTCAIKKDNYLVDKVFEYTSSEMRDSYQFQAEYARALLACGDYYSGMRLVKEFVARGLTNNSHNHIILEGLAEGRYFQECIRFYQHICMQRKKNDSICLYAHGYASVIKSACQLKRRHLAETLFAEMKKNHIVPLDYAFFEMCDLYENRSEWKKELNQIKEKLHQKDLDLSAAEECVMISRLKEKQFAKAMNVMREYCEVYDWKPCVNHEKKEVVVKADNFPESASRMLVLNFFHSDQFTASDSIQICLGKNVRGVVRLVSEDLIPRIPYHLKENGMYVNGVDVLKWLHSKQLVVC